MRQSRDRCHFQIPRTLQGTTRIRASVKRPEDLRHYVHEAEVELALPREQVARVREAVRHSEALAGGGEGRRIPVAQRDLRSAARRQAFPAAGAFQGYGSETRRVDGVTAIVRNDKAVTEESNSLIYTV